MIYLAFIQNNFIRNMGITENLITSFTKQTDINIVITIRQNYVCRLDRYD